MKHKKERNSRKSKLSPKNKIIRTELVLLVIIIIIGIVSFATDSEAFFEFSLNNIVTFIVTIVISFNAVEYLVERRLVKANITKLLEKIQSIVTDSELCKFDRNQDIVRMRANKSMILRRLNNAIDALSEYSHDYRFADELNYIQDEFKGLREFISENIYKIDLLQESEQKLSRYATNIEAKCDQILILLYR